MSGHGNNIPVPNVHEKQMPNQTFWGWLKTETALFISQIATILGIISYFATFSYYVFGRSEGQHEKSFSEYLDTADQVVFYSNIIVCILFIVVLVHILHKNDNGKDQVEQAFEKVFGKKFDKDKIIKSQASIKKFKIILIWYWSFAILFYFFLIAVDEKWSKHILDCITICLNTLGALIIFFCYEILYLSNTFKTENKRRRYLPRVLIISTCVLFWIFTVYYLIATPENQPLNYLEIKMILQGISGVINMITIAMLISKLDSKLIGIPSLLISLIYCYSIIQTLTSLFEVHPAIESIAYFLAFIFKIYFTIVIIYAMQTGRMLNFLCCNSELSKRLFINRDNLFTKTK